MAELRSIQKMMKIASDMMSYTRRNNEPVLDVVFIV